MAFNKKLAIYWGQDSFSIIESEKKRILSSKCIPFDTQVATSEAQDVPEGLKFANLIQQHLTDNGITAKKINLSLPTQDLIFRSFVIPWMQPDEIRSVVDFEATKYIPISLDDLSYAYHPVVFTENGQKNIRILFVAIRKDILERYTGILVHTGLAVDQIEPSSVSIARLLQKLGHASPQHSHAIILLGKTDNEIIIVDEGVVQFVRRFQISDTNADSSFLNAQLFNDIRVSFNFYSRQSSQTKITKIIALSIDNFSDLAKDLSSELAIPSISLKASQLLKLDSVENLDLLNAFGATLTDRSSSSKDFNLSDKAIKARKEGFGPSLLSKFKTTAGIIAVCGIILTATILFSNTMVMSKKKRLADLNAKQSSMFKSSEASDIEELKDKKSDKLKQYNDIRRGSEITLFLDIVPKLLPERTWLTRISLKYIETRKKEKKLVRIISAPAIELSGNVYHENPNEQFRIITAFVSNLREDEKFLEYFNNVERTSTGKSTIGDYEITGFTIKAKQELKDERK